MLGQFSNPFEKYRQSNLLGGTQRTTPTFGAPRPDIGQVSSDPTQPPDAPPMRSRTQGYDDEIMNLMKPSPGLLAYKQYLTTMPNEEDYKPNVGTRIAAAMGGFSAGLRNPSEGYKLADTMLSAPYKSALENYANRGYGLKESADIEQQDRDNQVKTLQQARAMGLDYDKLGLERYKADRGFSQKDTENQISRDRADAYIQNLHKGKYGPGVPLADGSLLYTNESNPADTLRVDPRKFGGSGTTAAGQLGVSQFNAGSQRMQAGAAVQGANTRDRNQTWLETRGAEPPKANEMGQAYDLALDYLTGDSAASKFIKRDSNNKLQINPDMIGRPGYSEFKDLLDETARGASEGNLFRNPAPQPTYAPRPPVPFMRGGGG